MMFTPFATSLTASFDVAYDRVGLALGMTREEFLERLDTVCTEYQSILSSRKMPGCVSSNALNIKPRSPFAFQLKSLCHADFNQHLA